MKGSVEKRGMTKKGLAWRLTVYGGQSLGTKYRRFRKTVYCDKKSEAEKELARFIMEIEKGEFTEPTTLSFEAFVAMWHQNYAKQHLSPTTYEKYERHLISRIIPAFGHFRLGQIQTIHVVEFVSKLSKSHIKSATQNDIYKVLRNVLSRATEWNLINKNPCNNVKPPKVKHQKSNVYDSSEYRLLVEKLKIESIQHQVLVLLAVACGLRRGEILGLQWDDIDINTKTIYIKHSLLIKKGSGYELREPKTESSVRKVIYPSELLDIPLKKLKKEQLEKRIKCGELYEADEHFFVLSSWAGKPLRPDSVTQWWGRFTKRTGIKNIRFHDLRHTSATLLINAGVHAKTISERLGHSDIKITMNVYGHHLKEADQKSADVFSQLALNE
ncbi:hypothetical protein BHU72_12680 [Desulfuribacillus stibiiarsenatis]|uniref:Integrase n=1 Tax=Desulfuribacillus stibiiarsenatis TaxID=1390249 RepID=A0A1E5L2T4_9FIRM|nr:site-specific integrase [Desulfuribacillus stibiiarsenatis]OEH84249.1 hypothetical protein BHU72_12680 [Desulfuribacillus stibiiarsenatis]